VPPTAPPPSMPPPTSAVEAAPTERAVCAAADDGARAARGAALAAGEADVREADDEADAEAAVCVRWRRGRSLAGRGGPDGEVVRREASPAGEPSGARRRSRTQDQGGNREVVGARRSSYRRRSFTFSRPQPLRPPILSLTHLALLLLLRSALLRGLPTSPLSSSSALGREETQPVGGPFESTSRKASTSLVLQNGGKRWMNRHYSSRLPANRGRLRSRRMIRYWSMTWRSIPVCFPAAPVLVIHATRLAGRETHVWCGASIDYQK